MSDLNEQIKDKRLPCTGDPELFFTTDGPEGAELVEIAKSVCQFCPAKNACLELALDTKDNWAIMGGTTPSERVPMLARRAARQLKQKEKAA